MNHQCVSDETRWLEEQRGRIKRVGEVDLLIEDKNKTTVLLSNEVWGPTQYD